MAEAEEIDIENGEDLVDEALEQRRQLPAFDVSATRIRRYEACALSYRFRYVDRLPDPVGPSGRVGLLIHAALEAVGRVRLGQASPAPADSVELAAALGAAVPLVEGATPEDLAAARARLDGVAPLDLADGGRILAVEEVWTFEVAPGVVAVVVLDLVLELPDGTIRAKDWKSGGARSVEEVENDAQAPLYLAALRARHPDAEVDAVFDWLGLGRARVAWSPELDALVRARARADHRAWSRGHARARVSAACARCFARDACAPYREELERRLVVAPGPTALKDLPLPELLRQRLRARDTATILDERRKDLDGEIRARLAGSGRREVEVEGVARASMRERRSGNYDVALLPEIAGLLGRDPYDVMRIAGRVSAEAVKKLTKGNEAAAALAERYRDPGKTRYLEVREKKGGSL